jgi:hypothetical protein
VLNFGTVACGGAVGQASASMDKVGPYVIIGRLATGGMAEVFLARRDGPAGFEKVAVLKQILPQFAEDPEFRRMFLDEARLAALINHPNVVQIFELAADPQQLYIAMEFVPGFDLAKVMDASLKQRRLLPAAVGARIVADAAAGLDFAHRLTDAKGAARGIVHRDISPENLLVSEVGQVKVVDFGIARAGTGHALSSSGRLKGKVHYHAPEHISGQHLDGKADVYALGVVLYELLCARRPFEGLGELEVMKATVEQDPPLPARYYPTAEPELSQIAMRALERDPRRRLSALELRDALELWLRRHPCTAADIERYLLEVIPADAPERMKARELLESAPVREKSAGPAAGPMRPAAYRPAVPERTVRDNSRLLRTAVPLVLSVLVGFAVVSWLVTRNPAPVLAQPDVPQPAVLPVPAGPPAGEVHVADTPSRPERNAEPGARPHPPPAKHHEVERAPPVASAVLSFKVTPARGTEVLVDGEGNGRPAGERVALAPGNHTLRFVNAALHLDATRTVHADAGRHREVRFSFERRPVGIRIYPWATVNIDGVDFGVQPDPNKTISLFEGRHQVRLRNGKAERTTVLTVASEGEPPVIHEKFTK